MNSQQNNYDEAIKLVAHINSYRTKDSDYGELISFAHKLTFLISIMDEEELKMFDKKCIKDRFIFSLLNPITEGTENGYILLILLVELLQMPNCIKLCSNNNVVSIISSSFIEGEWLFIQTGIKILLFLILSNNNGDINFIKPSLNHLIKLLSKSLIKKQNSVDQSQIVEESNNNLPSQDILYAYRPYLFQIFHYLCNNHNQLKTLILKQNFNYDSFYPQLLGEEISYFQSIQKNIKMYFQIYHIQDKK